MITLPALAQDDPLVSQVKQGLQDVNETLVSIRGLAACVSGEAQKALLKIEALRKEAEAKYNHALTLNDRQARNTVLNGALVNIRDAKTKLGEVELEIERAREALLGNLSRQRNNFGEQMRRAEQTVIGSGNRAAEQLVYQAKKIQSDAERAALSRNPCNALSLYSSATNLLMEAINLVEGRRPSPGATPETTISLEKDRYDNLEARVRDAVETGKNSAALPVLEQAQKQARAAEEAFRKGEVALAQQLYRGAARLLLRAIDLATAGQRVQDFGRNEVVLLLELIQTAEQEAKDDMTPRDALLLARARTLAGEAEAAIERKQMPEAKWRLELARSFIDKVMRKAGRSLGMPENMAQRYDEALQELARDIEEVRAKARMGSQPEALPLVELAHAAYQVAENAGRQNQPARPLRRFRLGFQMIRTAQYFLLRAETLLRESSTTNVTNSPARQTVVQQLGQLENSIQTLRQATPQDDPESCQAVAAQATELSKRAQAALEHGRTRLALVIVEVANDLVEQCLK